MQTGFLYISKTRHLGALAHWPCGSRERRQALPPRYLSPEATVSDIISRQFLRFFDMPQEDR